MTTTKTRRKRKLQIERMSVPELEKLLRVSIPEMKRLSTLVAFAERELERRNRHAPVAT